MQYFIILQWLYTYTGVLNLEQNMMNGAQRLGVNIIIVGFTTI